MSTEERIVDPSTGGEKGQKLERFDLLPFDALEELARVYGIGAKKYADDNWLKGYRWRLSLGALMRHVSRFMLGEDRDPETGCLHLAHAAWHCLTVLTFHMRKLGTDDRATPKQAQGPAFEILAPGEELVRNQQGRVVGKRVNRHTDYWPTAEGPPQVSVTGGLDLCFVCDHDLCQCPQDSAERPLREPDPFPEDEDRPTFSSVTFRDGAIAADHDEDE